MPELERQKAEDEAKQAELDRIAAQKAEKAEKARLAEVERQAELERQAEIERQAELERQAGKINCFHDPLEIK